MGWLRDYGHLLSLEGLLFSLLVLNILQNPHYKEETLFILFLSEQSYWSEFGVITLECKVIHRLAYEDL